MLVRSSNGKTLVSKTGNGGSNPSRTAIINTSSISIVAAIDQKGVIGLNGIIPWGKIPADIKHFVSVTLGKPIIMGRKTHESVGFLRNRINIVVSSDYRYIAPGCFLTRSLYDAIRLPVGEHKYVIGGESLYRQALNIRGVGINMHITRVDVDVEGDTYFPKFDRRKFDLMSHKKIQKDNINKYNLDFLYWVKKSIYH